HRAAIRLVRWGARRRVKPPNKVQVGFRRAERAPRQRFVRAVSADPTCVGATAWLPNKHSAQKSRCKPRQFSAAHPQVPFSHIATAFAPHHFGRAIWRGIHYEATFFSPGWPWSLRSGCKPGQHVLRAILGMIFGPGSIMARIRG